MRKRTRVKVCGITRAEDAAAAVAAGADAVGVIFALSPRQVSVEQAAAVLAEVPTPVARIGVFVDAPLDEVRRAVDVCGLTAVQLSGYESPEYCIECKDYVDQIVKVLHVGTDFDSGAAEPFRGRATALLLDTLSAGKWGGTSQIFDWRRLGMVPGWAPLFVAGGLHSGNVGECITVLRPFAVDVSSGVEDRPGVKDHAKLDAFIAAVRAADQEVYG
jgi:phosphoribosylanthranilate isomerase